MLFYTDTTNIYAVPTSQLPTGRVWWRVRAVNSRGGASRWSTASFSRSAPAGPSLVSPASGAVLSQPSNPPLLRWNPVSGARSYEIEIDSREHDWVETKTYTTSTTSLVVPDPQQPDTYWWRVRANLDGGISTRPSSARSYVFDALPVVRQASLVDDDPRDILHPIFPSISFRYSDTVLSATPTLLATVAPLAPPIYIPQTPSPCSPGAAPAGSDAT